MEIKMIKTGYYTKQQDKLVKTFKKTLKQYEPRLSAQYGEEFAKTINADAIAYYIELIPRIPYYETALYRPIILLNAQLIAIVGQIQGGNEG
jgi:hypothetical protein